MLTALTVLTAPRFRRLGRPRRLVAAMAALAAGLLLPACAGGGNGYRLTAYFEKTVSLYPHSDVKVLGLTAGEVDSVEVVGGRVKVEMTMRADQPVPPDVHATIVPLSLIGERYVQLFPAWTEGQPRLPAGSVIPLERTSIPTEPDEALAALKEFLDALDPNATGRLVRNLADDLEGNGRTLNDALRGLSDVTATFADKDEELVSILEHFDRLTATLRTREAQLGTTMDQFATLTGVLASERRDIERLVKALATLSTDALDLVSEHRTRLERDIVVLTRTLRSVDAHLDQVAGLLDSAPLVVAGPGLDGTRGLAGAWDPVYHHIDLRNATTPTLAQLFNALGIPSVPVCLPVDVACTDATTNPSGPTVAGAPNGDGAPGPVTPGGPAPPAPPSHVVEPPAVPRAPAPEPLDLDVGDDLLAAGHRDRHGGDGVLGVLRRGARWLVGVLG